MNPEQSTVLIIGAGTMGHSLALLYASSGWRVDLVDLDSTRLQKALNLIRSELMTLEEAGELDLPPDYVLDQIDTCEDYNQRVDSADLIIEAIIENVDAKKELFRGLADRVNPKTIVCSNTSYLNVFPLVPDSLQNRFLITHYFSPPHIVPLVEVVGGSATTKDNVARVVGWLRKMKMTPVVLRKFLPGFIVNRLQRAIGREILHMIDAGYADPQEIDLAVKSSLALRMPVVGVVKRYDFAGIDMALRALQAPSIELVSEDNISPTIKNMVEKGHLGVKTGRGFYLYKERQEEVLKERDLKLLEIRKLMRKQMELDL
jgi:3-hydroxybutyryl-CoA dehydrogenase